MEIHRSHASSSSGARVSQIRSLSQLRHRSRSAQHLIWCCGVMSLVEHSNQLRKRKARGKSVPIGPNATSTHKFPKLAAVACEPEPQTIHITDNPSREPEFRINMADYCFVQDAPGKEFVHNPGHVGHCFRRDGGNQRERKRGQLHTLSRRGSNTCEDGSGRR